LFIIISFLTNIYKLLSAVNEPKVAESISKAMMTVHPKPIVVGGKDLWRELMGINVVTGDFSNYWTSQK